MKSLLEFPPIVSTYSISNILKQLWLGSIGKYYGMIKERVVASFQYILDPGFSGDSSSVLKFSTKPETWQGLDSTGGLKHQWSYCAVPVNNKFVAANIRLQGPESIELASLCLHLSFTFMTSLSDFITR